MLLLLLLLPKPPDPNQQAWRSLTRCTTLHAFCMSSLPLLADTIRLLLVLGSRGSLADQEGCTPLHWAAIRGHTEACTVLLQVRAAAWGQRHWRSVCVAGFGGAMLCIDL